MAKTQSFFVSVSVCSRVFACELDGCLSGFILTALAEPSQLEGTLLQGVVKMLWSSMGGSGWRVECKMSRDPPAQPLSIPHVEHRFLGVEMLTPPCWGHWFWEPPSAVWDNLSPHTGPPLEARGPGRLLWAFSAFIMFWIYWILWTQRTYVCLYPAISAYWAGGNYMTRISWMTG